MTDPVHGRSAHVSNGLVLVTGASGFVGSAVARLARERGLDVRVVIARPVPGRILKASTQKSSSATCATKRQCAPP